MNQDLNFFITTMPVSRPADYYLGCCDGSVYIDFKNYDPEIVCLVRISFDGFGCCNLGTGAKPMDIADSKAFKDIINTQILNQDKLAEIIKKTIQINRDLIWEDAIAEYGL